MARRNAHNITPRPALTGRPLRGSFAGDAGANGSRRDRQAWLKWMTITLGGVTTPPGGPGQNLDTVPDGAEAGGGDGRHRRPSGVSR